MAAAIRGSAGAAQAAARRTAHAPLTFNSVEHLLARFSFGADPASRAWVNARGADAWFAHQIGLGRQRPGYSANPAVAGVGTLLGSSPAVVRAWLRGQGNEYGWTAMDQLTRVTLGLQAFSGAQLYETVVDFFANHLNVANHNSDVWTTRHTMDRDVIRRYAFASYTQMLLASARNPAMLQFLNLAQSTKKAVNENYGRELLELHTVGLGYSESDVTNSARILTGRTLDRDFNYVYKPEQHPVGPIQVLGFSHPNDTAEGGEAAGDAYLRYLAAHPQTATRLAYKLCLRYVSDTPSAGLVTAVANAYLRSQTQIVPMLQTIFHSDEFWASRGTKVRRPAENLIATVRMLAVKPTNYGKALSTLHWMSASVGNAPLDWSAPNGYPDLAAAWRSSGSMLDLWQFHIGFVQGWWEGFAKPAPATYYGGKVPATSGAAIDALTNRLTGMRFSPAHRQALQTFLGEPASTPIAKSNLKWRLTDLIAVILDGPHHALR